MNPPVGAWGQRQSHEHEIKHYQTANGSLGAQFHADARSDSEISPISLLFQIKSTPLRKKEEGRKEGKQMFSMNSGQKILLFMTISCGAVVGGVHWQQINEKWVMHQGVLRDLERIKLKNEKRLE